MWGQCRGKALDGVSCHSYIELEGGLCLLDVAVCFVDAEEIELLLLHLPWKP